MESKWSRIENLSNAKFRRLTGVKKNIFLVMREILYEHEKVNKSQGGRPCILCLEDQILLMLDYYKRYNPFYQHGNDYGVSETTAWRIVTQTEKIIISSGRFNLPGKKSCLSSNHGHLLLDVTESPIERPKKKLAQDFAIFRKISIQEKRNSTR